MSRVSNSSREAILLVPSLLKHRLDTNMPLVPIGTVLFGASSNNSPVREPYPQNASILLTPVDQGTSSWSVSSSVREERP